MAGPNVPTYRVLLREGDGDYMAETTYRGLTRPAFGSGPHLSQDGIIFVVDDTPIEDDTIYGWRASVMS